MRCSGWSAKVLTTQRRRLESGQTVSGIRSRARRATRASSSSARIAVVDALDAEQVDRLPDIVAAAPPRRHGRPGGSPRRGRARRRGELARGMADLRGIEPDADDPVLVAKRQIERPLGVGLVEMAQEAHDQLAADRRRCAWPRRARAAGRRSRCRRRCPRSRWACGIEEDLDLPDVLLPGRVAR